MALLLPVFGMFDVGSSTKHWKTGDRNQKTFYQLTHGELFGFDLGFASLRCLLSKGNMSHAPNSTKRIPVCPVRICLVYNGKPNPNFLHVAYIQYIYIKSVYTVNIYIYTVNFLSVSVRLFYAPKPS